MSFRMNEFETYENYVALKLHFTSEYDYFRYNGKTSVTLKSFNNRKDKYHFKRLAKKYEDSTIREYFVANMIANKQWIGDMDLATYSQWQARTQSIEYIFLNETENLLTQVEKPDIIFNCDKGNHPKLVKAYLGKKISLETLVIFEKLLHYRKRFDKEIRDAIIWPNVSKLIEKYEPFVEADLGRCKKLLIEKVGELRDE
tara:strand:+ start:520 stop:1119 length:600 start_codon:yes stop_codon:yes gene_type:complete